MERNRLMMIGAVLAAIVVVAGGFLLGFEPQLKAAQDAAAQTQTVTAQNDALQISTAQLKAKFEKIDTLKGQLADLEKSVPSSVDSGPLITELNTVAKKSGVTLTGYTPGTALAYAAPVVSTPAATTTTGSSASASATATPTPTPTASTPASPAVTTDSLITSSNFTTIPLTVSVQGSYAQALNFLQGLRDGDRLFLVTSITSAQGAVESSGTSTSTDSAGSTINWTFGGLVYALTDAQSAQAEQAATTSGTTASAGDSGSSSDTAAGK